MDGFPLRQALRKYTHSPIANIYGIRPSGLRCSVCLLAKSDLWSGNRWYFMAPNSRSLQLGSLRTSGSVSTTFNRNIFDIWASRTCPKSYGRYNTNAVIPDLDAVVGLRTGSFGISPWPVIANTETILGTSAIFVRSFYAYVADNTGNYFS